MAQRAFGSVNAVQDPIVRPRGRTVPSAAVAAVAAVAAAALLLAGCATRAPRIERDGAEANPPPNLERTPDAQPRVEPIRSGGANKPYEAFGRRYVPVLADVPMPETGLASWYGRKYHGRLTSSGEPYDMYAMTAAHPTMPLPSYASVRNAANGREIVVRVNDRGPFADGRVLDLSYTAALKLGVLGGVAPVQVRRITNAEIAAGMRPSAPPDVQAGAADAVAGAAAVRVDDAVAGDAVPEAGFWVQLGAFRAREGAAALQQRTLLEADGVVPGVAVRDEASLYRVQAGPWATRAEAAAAGARLRERLGTEVVLVERR